MNQQKVSKIIVVLVFLIPLVIGYIIDPSLIKINLGNPVETNNNVSQDFSDISNITGDIYFTPYKEDFYFDILSRYSSTLNIQMYSLTYDKIIKKLKEIASKGTKVNIILEKNKFGQASDFDKLKKSLAVTGITLKADEQLGVNFLHSKFLLFDDFFVIQTANFTYSSFYINRETFFVSSDQEILKSLKKVFDKDRNGEKINPQDIHPNLLVCNIDCRSKLEKYIKSAKQSVYIENQTLTDASILEALKSKKDIDLKMVLADNDNNLPNKDIFGDKVKFIKKPYIHNKAMLIDGKILIVGSVNLTVNSMDNNREVAIILTDQKLINKFLGVWQKDRQNN